MNLISPSNFNIQKHSDDEIFFRNFRQKQMEMIPEIFNALIEYIAIQDSTQELKVSNLSSTDKQIYKDFGYHEVLINNVFVTKKDKEKYLYFTVNIPKLIYGSYFIINGVYVPTVYILDKPISVKKNSYKFYGLFNSITLLNKSSDKTVIFMGTNIPSNYFIQMCLYNEKDSVIKDVLDKLDLTKTTESNAINYLQKRFKLKEDKLETIYPKIENLFLDNFTKKLYKACYPDIEKITLKDILKFTILEMKSNEFIDLNHKRVMFIELLLTPLLKRAAHMANQVLRGYEYNDMLVDPFQIVKHFLNDLHGNYLYNSVNLINTVGSKCSMLSPSTENAPSSIALLHPTHFGRICPASVSSQRPGETIMLSPDVKLDKYGQFIN